MIVANSGQLIMLSKLGYFSILKEFFREISIPHAVWVEVVERGEGRPGAEEVAKADWIKVHQVQNSFSVDVLSHEIERGEAEVIVLAKELSANLVIMDERIPREIAESLGLKVVGTLALVHEAISKKLIKKPFDDVVKEMREKGFWISDDIIEAVRKTN